VVKPPDGYAVRPGTGMQVVVGSGTAYTDVAVVAGEQPRQGNYVVRLDQPTPTFTVPAANPSLPRRDEVYLVVYDKAFGSPPPSVGAARLAYRVGDAASSPTAPGADTAWEASLLLGEISIPAGAVTPTVIDRRGTADFGSSGGAVPVGSILPYGGAAAPAGWQLCNGASLSRTSYPRLFAAIGTTYGSADAFTFRVPNLQGRFPIGTGGTAAKTLGEATGSLTTASATHDHSRTTTTDGAHKHTGLEVKSGGGSTGGALDNSGGGGLAFEPGPTKHQHTVQGHTHDLDWSDGSAGGHSHDVVVTNGGAHTHGYTPPLLGVNWIIRAA
jgi:microcystin-dependent protein